MKISISKPPCWDEANKLFRLEELNMGTIFCYGSTIYNPFNIEISDDLIVHEETHSKQQGGNDTGAKLWWRAFIDDVGFRLEQEVEAYHAQYKFLCRKKKDRNAQARMLNTLAGQLSSPMYGGIITHTAAMTAIRNGGIIKKEKSGTLRKAKEFLCEFCGGELDDDPDRHAWRILDRTQEIHTFCSYLCVLRHYRIHGQDKKPKL